MFCCRQLCSVNSEMADESEQVETSDQGTRCYHLNIFIYTFLYANCNSDLLLIDACVLCKLVDF